MTGIILEVQVVIQGGAILEASAAVHICHEAEAAVEVVAIVAEAEVCLQKQNTLDGVHYLFQDPSQDPDLHIHPLDAIAEVPVQAKAQGARDNPDSLDS